MPTENANISFNSVLEQAIARQRKLSKTNKLLHLSKNQLLPYNENQEIKASGKALKAVRFHNRFQSLYGINPSLFVGNILHWYDPKTSKQYSSPLICQRIAMTIQKDLEDKLTVEKLESSFINPVLQRYFSVHFNIDLQADDTIDLIKAACERNNIEFSNSEKNNSWWIEHQAYIGNFDYSSLYFEEDLIQIEKRGVQEWVSPMRNSIPFNFVGPFDISQKQFCETLLKGSPCVLQGPPGTGKSQTIVNLISSYASSGKKVLMVSSKKAAIDVVEKKLNDAGLNDLVFKTTQYNDSLHQVYKSVVKTVESWENQEVSALQEQNYIAYEDLIRSYIDQKSEYIPQLGMSIHKAITFSAESAPVIIDRYLPTFHLWSQNKEKIDFWTDRFQSDCWISLSDVVRDNDHPFERWFQKVSLIHDKKDLIDQLKSFNKADDLTLENLQKYNVLAQALSNIPITTLSFILNNKTKRNQLSASIRKLKALAVYEEGDTLFVKNWSVFPTEEEVAYLEKQIKRYNQSGKLAISRIKTKKSIVKFVSRFKKKPIEWNALVGHLNDWYKRDTEKKKIIAKIIRELQVDLSEKSMLIQISHLIDQMDQDIQFYEQLKSSSRIALVLQNLQEQSNIVEQIKYALRYLFINPFEISINEVQNWASWVMNHKDFVVQHKQDLFSLITSFTSAEKSALIKIWGENTHNRILSNTLALAIEDRPLLKKYDDSWLMKKLQMLSGEKVKSSDLNALNIINYYKNRVLETEKFILQKTAGLSEMEKKEKKNLKEERKLFIKEIFKKRQHIGIKQLIEKAPGYFFQYKPIHLLSPQVVASSIPCIQNLYDIVIFDESSQIHLDEAISSIYRSKNFVVVGDPQQMPPSMWFEKEEDQIESLLDFCIPRLPKQTLKWHYRSKNPELIAFSNTYFYDDLLKTFPSSSEIVPFEIANVGGHYENGVNAKEVDKVVALVSDKREQYKNKTIGIIALSNSQSEAISKALIKQGIHDIEVYNLENAQGDEQEIVILSIGYGAKNGEPLNKNFGPINQDGGPQRLNVLFTRAIEQVSVVHSFPVSELMDTTNEGLILLRKYLEFVESKAKNNIKNPTENNENIIRIFELDKDLISYLLGLENLKIPYKIEA